MCFGLVFISPAIYRDLWWFMRFHVRRLRGKCVLECSRVLGLWIVFHMLAKAWGSPALMAAFIFSSPQSPFPSTVSVSGSIWSKSLIWALCCRKSNDGKLPPSTSGRRYELLLSEPSLQLGVHSRIFKAVEVHFMVPHRQPDFMCISKPLERCTKRGWNGRLFVIWGE